MQKWLIFFCKNLLNFVEWLTPVLWPVVRNALNSSYWKCSMKFSIVTFFVKISHFSLAVLGLSFAKMADSFCKNLHNFVEFLTLVLWPLVRNALNSSYRKHSIRFSILTFSSKISHFSLFFILGQMADIAKKISHIRMGIVHDLAKLLRIEWTITSETLV